MKKTILPILLLLGSYVHSQAPRGFYGGLGVNQTMISSDDLLADPAMGYSAGINFEMGYHESYNYQMEIKYNYSQLDLLTVDQNFELGENSKHSFATVDVGLFFNYYILKPDEDKFFIGPQVGINAAFAGKFQAKDEKQEEYYLPHRIQKLDLDNVPKVLMAGGIGLTGGYNDFRFDLRYSLGLTNFMKEVQTNSYNENNTYTGPALEGKMNMISFFVSYNIFTWTNK